MARIRDSDAVAYRRVFETYYEPLLLFAQKYVHSAEIAREVIQDVFSRLWRQRAGWVLRDTLRGYLYGAVRNACLNELKRQATEADNLARTSQEYASTPSMVPALGQASLSAQEELEVEERRVAIWNAVQQLPERRRMVVTLRWQHQLSYSEIAEAMDISVKGVEIQLARALADLAKSLERFVR